MKPLAYWKTLIHRQLFDSWGRKRHLQETRPGSFPFISGDTFRELSDLVYDGTNASKMLSTDPQIVFCPVESCGSLADSLASINTSAQTRSSLIVHNGDVIPDVEVFRVLYRFFSRIFSVNLSPLHEHLGVIPIPQGLENLAVDRSGRAGDYPRPFERSDLLLPWDRRPIEVFASFRVGTNEAIRLPLRQLIKDSCVNWLEPCDNQDVYLRRLRASQFVISPRGNGPDCHRTWEAIYWGCVPVIERGTLPAVLTDSLPILVVESFAAFLELGAQDRNEAGRSVLRRSTEKAWMPYWCGRLSDQPSDWT